VPRGAVNQQCRSRPAACSWDAPHGSLPLARKDSIPSPSSLLQAQTPSERYCWLPSSGKEGKKTKTHIFSNKKNPRKLKKQGKRKEENGNQLPLSEIIYMPQLVKMHMSMKIDVY